MEYPRRALFLTLSILLLAACSSSPAASDGSFLDRAASDTGPPAAADGPAADAGVAADRSLGDGGQLSDRAGLEQGGPAFKPYFFDDFESYAPGQSLSGNQPFDAAGRTTASTAQAFSGSKSARMEIHEGDGGGFGKWGGILKIKPPLIRGQEIWVRLRVYWPAAFKFTASPWMKFLRLHNYEASLGGNGGYNDLYIDEADSTKSVLRCIKERHDVWKVYDGSPIARDKWETYEMYLRLDNVPAEKGGQGRFRVWRDTQLIFDRTDVPTLVTAAGSIDYFYLFTYWNNESPPSNTCYVDDLVIATSASPPPRKDAAGNPFVGDW